MFKRGPVAVLRSLPVLVRSAFFANSAHVGHDGLLYVQGGGWEFFDATALPSLVAGHICGLIEFELSEIGDVQPLSLEVVGTSGEVIGRSSAQLVAVRRLGPFSFGFGFRALSAGPFSARIFGAESELPMTVVECEVRVPS